jgi:hypothetical protein
MAQLVVADCRNDERGRFGRRVFLASDDGVRGIREFRSSLGRARFDILFSRKKLVRADRGDAFEEASAANRAVEAALAVRLSSSVPSLSKPSFARWYA